MYKTIVINTRSTYWTNPEFGEELMVDSEDLGKELQHKCTEIENEGFTIISILPIVSGNVSNGNGYYQTHSVIISAHK